MQSSMMLVIVAPPSPARAHVAIVAFDPHRLAARKTVARSTGT
jgi:hypothetical protein